MDTPWKIRFLRAALSFLPFGGIGAAVDEWEVVHHPRVVLFYPADWTISKDIPGALLELSSAPEGAEGSVNKRLLLRIEDLPDGETFDSFVDREVATLRENSEEAVVLGDEPAQRGPHSGRAVELSHQSGEHRIMLELFFFEQGGDIFVVTQSGSSSDYETTEPIFHRIIAGIHPLKEIFPNAYFHRDFVIQIPDDWAIKEGMPGTVVAALSPKTRNADPFRERVTVGFERIPEGMSFEQYAEKNFEILLKQLRGARERGKEEPVIDGRRARAMELSHESTGPRTILRVTMVPSGDHVFALIAAGRDPDYSRMRETFNRILNSFASPTPPGKDSRSQ